MKRTLIAASFIALFGGATGAGAQTLVGSDTLNAIVKDLLITSGGSCLGAGVTTYTDSGSGSGENAMRDNKQNTAPMSRFLQGAKVCAAAAPNPTGEKAEAIAMAKDGLSLNASSRVRTACDPGAVAEDCNKATITDTGIRYTGTGITGGTYTPGNVSTGLLPWQDIIRLVYFGLDNTDPINAGTSSRDCADPDRLLIVNSWSNFFENECTTCTKLMHAFRRDEGSGTTGAFKELISVDAGAASTTAEAKALFCNVARSTDVGVTLHHPRVTSELATAAAPASLYTEANQDNDPIRRTVTSFAPLAAGADGLAPGAQTQSILPPGDATPQPDFLGLIAEQVASFDHTLGLVVPVLSPTGALGQAASYPKKACRKGNFRCAPRLLQSTTSECPGGTPKDICGGTSCVAPHSDDGIAAQAGFDCLNGENNGSPLTPGTNNRDGRVYNMVLRDNAGAIQSMQYLGVGSTARVLGAMYRIHQTRTLLDDKPTCAGDVCCQEADDTKQLGCLVQANPCSVSFAGREATGVQLQTCAAVTPGSAGNTCTLASAAPESGFGLSVNAVSPALDSCIINNNYVISRLLFLSTLKGFATDASLTVNVPDNTADEFTFAKCMSGNGISGTTLSTIVGNAKFVPIAPFCKDFSETKVTKAADATMTSAQEGCNTNPAGTWGDACASDADCTTGSPNNEKCVGYCSFSKSNCFSDAECPGTETCTAKKCDVNACADNPALIAP